MEIIKLIGVLIVVIGFILKLDTLAVVVVAGLATGLVAGMSPMDILHTGHRIYHQPYCHPFHPYTAGDRTV